MENWQKTWKTITKNEEYEKIPKSLVDLMENNELAKIKGKEFELEGQVFKINPNSGKKFFDDAGLDFDWNEFPYFPISKLNKDFTQYLVFKIEKKKISLFVFDEGEEKAVSTNINDLLKGENKKSVKKGLSLTELKGLSEETDKLFSKEKYKEVIAVLEPLTNSILSPTKNIDEEIEIENLIINLGYSYTNSNNLDLAERFYLNAHEKLGGCESLLCELYIEHLKEFTKAIPFVEKLLNKKPFQFSTWLHGMTYKSFLKLESGSVAEGKKLLAEIFESVPTSKKDYSNLVFETLQHLSNEKLKGELFTKYKKWQ